MYTALIVLVVIAIVLLGAGVLMIWRPWRRSQQEEDVDERREAELDELRHQFEVERLRGAIHRHRVFDHAIWPTHGLLTAVEDAVGHKTTEQTVGPLVGYVTEQALRDALSSGHTNEQAEQEEEQEEAPRQGSGRLRALWTRFWGWLRRAFKWIIIVVVVLVLLNLVGNLLARQPVSFSPAPEATLLATSSSPVRIGTINQSGNFKFRVDGSVNIGTGESFGPFGSSWHTGKEYGDKTPRPDLPSGCLLVRTNEGNSQGLVELEQADGAYLLTGQPGEAVWATLNETNYADNQGSFGFFNY